MGIHEILEKKSSNLRLKSIGGLLISWFCMCVLSLSPRYAFAFFSSLAIKNLLAFSKGAAFFLVFIILIVMIVSINYPKIYMIFSFVIFCDLMFSGFATTIDASDNVRHLMKESRYYYAYFCGVTMVSLGTSFRSFVQLTREENA